MPNYNIVILSYNHPELTAKTVRSVLHLRFPPQQITLVHNGSEKKHQQILENEFLTIEHISLSTNNGYTKGANFGLQHVFHHCDQILFLTNDTEALTLPGQFPENLDFFSVAILKRNTQQMDSMIGEVNLRTGELTHVRSPADLSLNDQNTIKTYIPGTAFGITKKAFTSLGGFIESYHTYWEDVDMSLRAHALKLNVGYSLDFKIKHKIGKTCHKHRFYTLYLFQRNKRHFLKKYSDFHITFRLYYYASMLRLATRLLVQPQRKAHFHFWWKALCD